VKDQVLEIVSQKSKRSLSEILEKMNSKGLWDSFSQVELVLALEEAFDIHFEAEEIAEIDTPQKALSLVITKVNS
jgi:acyl carrier protein